jgi:energy-coupling factor transporter transmembrane protein EcfT
MPSALCKHAPRYTPSPVGGRKMIKRYQHTQIGYSIIIALAITLLFMAYTQIGYSIIIALAITLLFMAYLVAVYGFNWIAFTVLIILGVCLVLFATLTVVIEKDVLEIRFGPGVIRKKFPLKDIGSCQIVKNPWYYGWGIRLTPYGWLYNVSGSCAVEISMKTAATGLVALRPNR